MEPEGYTTYHSYSGPNGTHSYRQPTSCTCWPYDWAPARTVQRFHEVEFIDPLCRYHANT